MSNYLGLDLGTSALKVVVINNKGEVLSSCSVSYPLSFPHPGWSEEEPEAWWNACKKGIKKVLEDVDPNTIKGIGTAGQMHGLVTLDKNDSVIRPAILWNDGRSEEESGYLNNVIGKDKLIKYTGNISYAGFTAPKILWMEKHEKENFDRIEKIMLPKDYINYRLTGAFATDYSDASGMLLLDVKKRAWSDEMIAICHIKREQLPTLFESYERIGTLKCDVARELGLNSSVVVAAGAGDNAGAAISMGVSHEGECNISLGTSGTVFIPTDNFCNLGTKLHSFAHANGHYHLMACMLSAASCNKWFYEEILKTNDYQKEQEGIKDENLGNNSVYYLPYLMGERSPINDTEIRASFLGLSLSTTRSDMVQSVLEGVAFALRDNMEIAKSYGIEIKKATLCGGGAKSRLWQKIIANVLDIELMLPTIENGPGVGGALLSSVASEEYKTIDEALSNLSLSFTSLLPDKAIVERYNKKYETFKKIYPSLKGVL